MEAYLSEWLSLLVRWFHVIVLLHLAGQSPAGTTGMEEKRGHQGRPVGHSRRWFLRDRQVQTGAEGNAPGTALVQMGSLFNPA